MADPDKRLYGMADSANHQAPAENGMRGEGAADREGTYRREVTPPDQPAILVEEESGVAFAEANGAVPSPGHDEAAQEQAGAPAAARDAPPIVPDSTSDYAGIGPAPSPAPADVPAPSAPVPRIYPQDDWYRPAAPSPWPWIAAALGIGYLVGRRRRRRADAARRESDAAPAALARWPGERDSVVQVRNAGPEELRDPPAQWSRVDEAVDESFPASDPPAY